MYLQDHYIEVYIYYRNCLILKMNLFLGADNSYISSIILSSGDIPSVEWDVAIEWEVEGHLDLGLVYPIFAGGSGTVWDLVLSMSFSALISPASLSWQFSFSSPPCPTSRRGTDVQLFPPPPYPIPHVATFAVVFAIVIAVAFLLVAAFVVAVFILVEVVPSVVAAIFVAFQPDAVVDDVSPAPFAPAFVVGHPTGEKVLPVSVHSSLPPSKPG